MREESPIVVAAFAQYAYELPDTPYNLWVRGELADHLYLPNDGSRVEVVGGEIVVSPMPRVGHNAIISELGDVVALARRADPLLTWRSLQTTDLNLAEIEDGYVPDLLLVPNDIFTQVRRADEPYLFPHQVGMAVEVTSPSGAATDRQPGPKRLRATKWSGYAQANVGHYLLIDRDPKSAQTTLFTNPVPDTGEYRHAITWEFGETIKLPEPFGFDIPTDEWEPWA